MSLHRIPSLLLCFAVGLWTGSLDADGSLSAGTGQGTGARGTGTRVEVAPVAIPFAHRVGERWRIVVDRWDGVEGSEGKPLTVESEAEVLSPYGRDFLVEVRAVSLTEGGRMEAMTPRTAANAARLDARGGGRLALRVDVRGSVADLLNAAEVRAALVRAHGSALADAAWEEQRRGLLDEWNSVYQACGVPLVPGRSKATALRSADEREVGRDVRALQVEQTADGAAVALLLSADTVVDAAAEGTAWRDTSTARFELALRRLSGTRVVERRAPQATSRVRLAFREAAAPALQPAALAAR